MKRRKLDSCFPTLNMGKWCHPPFPGPQILAVVISLFIPSIVLSRSCKLSIFISETTAELLHLEYQRIGTMKSSVFSRGCRMALEFGEISSGFTNVGYKVVGGSSRKENGMKIRRTFLRGFPLRVFFRLWFEKRKFQALNLSLDKEVICLGPNFMCNPLGSIEDKRVQIHK